MYDFDRPRTARPDAAGTGVVAGSARLAPCDRHPRAPREGDVRIPAGCAIAAIMDRSGARHDGSDILRSIALMHDRSNGLGGGFAAYGIYPEYEELYAAGCVGLVKAVDRFEPERGLCFSTYAVPVILGEIRRLFRDGGSVKISRSLKELSVKAARLRDQLSANGEPRISDIAQALGVTPEEAAEALCAGIPPVSLDHGGEDGEPLPVPSASGEDALIDRLALRQCLSELSGEDREILMLRYFRRKTQCETAQILGMTQVMVSRRERKLLKELREQLV